MRPVALSGQGERRHSLGDDDVVAKKVRSSVIERRLTGKRSFPSLSRKRRSFASLFVSRPASAYISRGQPFSLQSPRTAVRLASIFACLPAIASRVLWSRACRSPSRRAIPSLNSTMARRASPSARSGSWARNAGAVERQASYPLKQLLVGGSVLDGFERPFWGWPGERAGRGSWFGLWGCRVAANRLPQIVELDCYIFEMDGLTVCVFRHGHGDPPRGGSPVLSFGSLGARTYRAWYDLAAGSLQSPLGDLVEGRSARGGLCVFRLSKGAWRIAVRNGGPPSEGGSHPWREPFTRAVRTG